MEITLPHDSYVESMLLSMALNSSTAAASVLCETDMEDYYAPRHRLLYSILKELFDKGSPFDINLIFHEIQKRGMALELSKENLIVLSRINVSSGVCDDFTEKLKTLSGLRRVIYASKSSITDAAMKDADLEDIINTLQDKLLTAKGKETKSSKHFKDLSESFSQGLKFNDYMDWRFDRKRKGLPPYDGISSGYRILDETLGFFRNSCIYYIGARTSMGKTTFLINLMNNMKDKSIGFFSLEMPFLIIHEKMMCLAADVRYSDYEDLNISHEELERLKEVAHHLPKRNIIVEDPSSITISQLRASAKKMKTQHGIEILFIDYLTRIRGGKHTSKHLEVDEVSKGLQSLAKELEIPIVCLAQLNRLSAKEVEGKVREPSLMDFRESGSIEEDADACLLIHRPDYYNKNDSPGSIYIKVAKNRLRGLLRKIEFTCNSKESDRYHEQISCKEQYENIQNRECDTIADNIRQRKDIYE